MGLVDRWKGPLNEADFATALIKCLNEAGDDRKCRFDSATFQLHFTQAGRDAGYANLRNLYDEYRNQPSGDDQAFFRFAARSLLVYHKPLPDEYGDLSCDLLLSVRSRAYFSLFELRTQLEQ